MSPGNRVMIEVGRKRVVAVPFDWPGWDRPGKTEEHALEVLESFRPRYRKVAVLAGLQDDFDAAGPLQVVEHIDYPSTVDYAAYSSRPASVETEQMSDAECDRKLALLQACWTYFDQTWPRVSEELKKGPRGSGRDRDRIVRHTYAAETDYSRGVGVRTSPEEMLDPAGRQHHREAFVVALRTFNAENRKPNIAFTIRRSCYHMLDHAWEMEDKDLG
ncbi:MAG: hypothetical protein AB7V46_19720, partial [Thermomicrobiales bacterium]